MRIWIDADAAPRDVRDVAVRAGTRLCVQVIFVGAQPHVVPSVDSASAVDVSSMGDGADAYISRQARAGDVVITSDVLLASDLVLRGIAALDMRGGEHTADTIDAERSVREFVGELRARGNDGRGPPPFDARAKHDFAAALDRTLTRINGA